jgi:UDP-2-acetamido-2,6-beta-L-arabino-hexul-4-ose reductase
LDQSLSRRPRHEDEGVPLKALVTGANGFIGKNLVIAASRTGASVVGIDADASAEDWLAGVQGTEVVFHLAGVNRPKDDAEFERGNVQPLRRLLDVIERAISSTHRAHRPLIVLASSTQAGPDNAYGRSKLAAEELLKDYADRTGGAVIVYRLPGVFGKWCRPSYNSVVATFCHNLARDLPIVISNPDTELTLVYVDDVVSQFLTHLRGAAPGDSRGHVQPVFALTLADLASRLRGFRESRASLDVPDVSDPLTRRLLATYTSYIPRNDLAYELRQRTDSRGTLAELLESPRFGQLFVSRTHPGITRGHHYHDMKVEKFCVIEGDAVIRFRSILGGDTTEHRVKGTDFKVVDIPPGLVHSIENIGAREMIVLFWASEVFDQEHPDTHSSEALHD